MINFAKILNLIRSSKRSQPVVVFFGKTGVGKSSTINAIFGLNWATDHAIACTKKPQFTDIPIVKDKWFVIFVVYLLARINLSKMTLQYLRQYSDIFMAPDYLRIVDLPGIGESLTADEKYMAFYKKWVAKADVLVWITQADTRAYKRDEIFLKKLKPYFKPAMYLILALNKIDHLGVHEGQQGFLIDEKKPSLDQLSLIPEKIDDIYEIFDNALSNAIAFNKSHIMPYTSVYGWGLDEITKEILQKSNQLSGCDR